MGVLYQSNNRNIICQQNALLYIYICPVYSLFATNLKETQLVSFLFILITINTILYLDTLRMLVVTCVYPWLCCLNKDVDKA